MRQKSSAEISQNPHSRGLGTLLAGSPVLRRPINPTRFFTNLSSAVDAGMSTS